MMSAYHSKGISTAGIEAEHVVSHFLKVLDSDGDGVITKEEFVQEGLKNPKLLPLLVNHNWTLGEDFVRQRVEKFLQAAKGGKLDRVKALAKDVEVDVLGDAGDTALYLAARKHPQVVQYLLEAGADPKLSNFIGSTPLHRAAMSNNIDNVNMLIKAGADLDAANVDGWTPLHMAVMEGHLDIVKHLISLQANYSLVTRTGLGLLHIAAGADQGKMISFLSSEYECALDVGAKAEFEKEFSPLHFAAQDCNYNAMKTLLKCGAKPDQQDIDGMTPLAILARRTGADRFPTLEDCAKVLLASHANPLIGTFDVNNTPLHIAALANNVVVCHVLVTAKRELMLTQNKDGKTPLQLAQREAQVALLKDHMSVLPDHTKILLEACRQNDLPRVREMAQRGGDPNVQDGAGNSALYFTILNKNVEAAVVLLHAGARLDTEGERGTPLHAAIMTGVVPLVTALLDNGADPKKPDPQWGMLPIHTAAFFGKPLVIRVLVGRKLATVEDASEDGKRAIHWAAQRGQVESVATLLSMNAFMEAVTNDGLTALHLAAAHGRSPLIKLLLDSGANPDVCCPDGRTVLHLAVQEGDANVVGMLMQASPLSIMRRTTGGDTILHRLCMGGATDVILQFQGEHGKELMVATNDFGQTPLHVACRFCSVQFVETLLKLHPTLDVNIFDKDGYSPIYYAALARKDDLVKLLKNRGAYFREERVTSDQIVFEASEGFPVVGSATIEGLIDYLLLTCDKIDDSAFRDAFFLSYRQILSPAALLKRLIERYDDASTDASMKKSGFVPNMRESGNLPKSVTSSSAVDRRKQKKKVGLRKNSFSNETAPLVTFPADPKKYLLVPENRLRKVFVLRLLRHWISHSYMDFDSLVALRADSRKSNRGRKISSANTMQGSFSSSRNLVKEQSFKTINVNPLLRGNSPDDNMLELVQFLGAVDANEEHQMEVNAINKAIDDIRGRNAHLGAEIQTISKRKTFRGEMSFLDWGAEISAQQLCIMSKKLWNSLSLWEFYNVVFTKKNKDELAPNINALIRHINRVGDWAKSIILSMDDAKKRGQCIVYMINVMDQCINIRDFSDALGLATALQATSLERLAKSWRYVPEETVALLDKAKTLTDPRGNYKNLRQVIGLQPNEPRIPLISLIMGDLIHADEVTGKIEGRHNWYKYELLGRVLSVIPKYQRIQYPFAEEREFSTLFNSQDFLDAEQVRAVSKQLEPPEN